MMNVLKKTVFFFLATFAWISGYNQEQLGLKVGDAIQDLVIGKIINYSKPEVKLSDFKDKLLIIDFWATWCHPCVASFPKLDSLQRKYNNFVQLLPVTHESLPIVEGFFDKMNVTRGTKLASVVEDKKLQTLFPHNIVPHSVWIKNGIIVAITGGEEISDSNIKTVLQGKSLTVKVKQDNPYNIVRELEDGIPVFMPAIKRQTTGNIQIQSLSPDQLEIHTVITKSIPGMGAGTYADSSIVFCSNATIYWLYRCALWNHSNDMLSEEKTIVDIADSSLRRKIGARINGEYIVKKEEWPEWAKLYTFNAEVKVPKALVDQKFNILLNNLNLYFGNLLGIIGTKEKRMSKYLALIKIDKQHKLSSKGGEKALETNAYWVKMENCYMQGLLNALQIPLQNYPPIIDETGYKGTADLELFCELSDLNAVNKELGKYGLKLEQREKLMDIGVIKMK